MRLPISLRLVFLICALLLGAGPAHAAVTFDTNCTAAATAGGGAASLSVPCTVSGGSNRLLVVGVMLRANAGVNHINTMTYNGANMTNTMIAYHAGQTQVEVWQLLSPSVGTFNVIITPNNSTQMVAGGHSWAGVDPVDPIRLKGSDTSSSLTPSITLAGTLAGNFVADFCGNVETTTVTVGGGQTQRWNLATGGGAGVTGCGSTKAAGGDATTTWTWNVGAQAMALVEISAPWGGAAPPTGAQLDQYGGSAALQCAAPNSSVTPNKTQTITQVARTGSLATFTVADTTDFYPNQAISISGTTTDAGSFNTIPGKTLLYIRSKTSTTLTAKQSGSDVSGSDSGTVRLARFYVSKIGSRWWWCTPLQNAIVLQGVFDISRDSSVDYQSINTATLVASKYATGMTTSASLNWALGVVRRLSAWGFNLLGEQGTEEVLKPTNVDGAWPTIDQTIPIHLPFVGWMWPSHYSQTQVVGAMTQTAKSFGNVKRSKINLDLSNTYYRQIDPFDPNFSAWVSNVVTDVAFTQQWVRGPNNDYLAFWVVDDGDSIKIDKGGVDFPTYYGGVPQNYPGNSIPHYGLLALVSSPTLTAIDSTYNGEIVTASMAFPADRTFYAKSELASWLQSAADSGPNYASISALNTAWGSTYTSFGSTATDRSDTICAGSWNGSLKTCSVTLANVPVTPLSVYVTIDTGGGDVSQAVGDNGTGPISNPATATGNFVGTGVSGTNTINYTTGAITITFLSAPANGATVKVKYKTGGWGVGSGLLDEDGVCPAGGTCWVPTDPFDICGSHPNWSGTLCTNGPNVTAAFRSDMDNFFKHLVKKYYATIRATLSVVSPGVPYIGSTNATRWYSVPWPQSLQAMTLYLDVVNMLPWSDGRIGDDQARLNFVTANAGDMPMMQWVGMPANPDSYLSPYASTTMFWGSADTQADRGILMNNYFAAMLAATDANYSSTHYVGYRWWQYYDQLAGENQNWGLVTRRDDPYDGYSARRALGRDAYGYPTGCFNLGATPCEQGDYGDFTTLMSRANALWLNYINRPLRGVTGTAKVSGGTK